MSHLYLGAGWDFKPVKCFPFKHFVFVDALSDHKHYQPGQSGYQKQENFWNCFIAKAAKYGLKLKQKTTDANDCLVFRGNGKEVFYFTTSI